MTPFKEAIAKKERLTLTQLASYDDILTDTLVDHVRIDHSRSDYHSLLRVCYHDLWLIDFLGVLLDYYPKKSLKIQSHAWHIRGECHSRTSSRCYCGQRSSEG